MNTYLLFTCLFQRILMKLLCEQIYRVAYDGGAQLEYIYGILFEQEIYKSKLFGSPMGNILGD